MIGRMESEPLYLYGGNAAVVRVDQTIVGLGSDDETPSDEEEEEESQVSRDSLAVKSPADRSSTASPSGSGTRAR